MDFTKRSEPSPKHSRSFLCNTMGYLALRRFGVVTAKNGFHDLSAGEMKSIS